MSSLAEKNETRALWEIATTEGMTVENANNLAGEFAVRRLESDGFIRRTAVDPNVLVITRSGTRRLEQDVNLSNEA